MELFIPFSSCYDAMNDCASAHIFKAEEIGKTGIKGKEEIQKKHRYVGEQKGTTGTKAEEEHTGGEYYCWRLVLKVTSIKTRACTVAA